MSAMHRIPELLDISSFAQARINELEHLNAAVAAVANKDGPNASEVRGLQDQENGVPHHMRRRTLSYKSRPRHSMSRNRRSNNSHAEGASNATGEAGSGRAVGEAGKVAAPTRCRKHRRRPRNMLEARSPHAEDLPEGAPARWLENHIWHAKRMHMGEAWGFILPMTSHRGPRGAVEAALKHCTLQDVTFIRPIEIRGPLKFLLEFLASVTDPLDERPRLPSCVRGYVEASTHLYRVNRFPLECIAPVTVMWSPPEGTFFGGIPASNKDSMDDGREGGGGGANAPHAAPGDELRTDEAYMTTDDGHNVDTRLEEDRKLWLWVHAAAVEETLQEMKNACALDSTSWCGSLEVGPIRGGLSRLRIRGHRAHEIVQKVVRASTGGEGPKPSQSKALKTASKKGHDDTATRMRFEKTTRANGKRWRSMMSSEQGTAGSAAGNLPHGSVLAFAADDPREVLHKSAPGWDALNEIGAAKSAGDGDSELGAENLSWPPPLAPVSPLWDPDARAVSAKLASTQRDDVLNKRWRDDRARLTWDAIPALNVTKDGQFRYALKGEVGRKSSVGTVPVILVSSSWDVPKVHPGNNFSTGDVYGGVHCNKALRRKRRDVAQGWDLIVSAGWAPMFFRGLVMAGARALSLADADVLALEAGIPRFPADFPDTRSGLRHWYEMGVDIESAWKRRRPKHRGYKVSQPSASSPTRAGGPSQNRQVGGSAEISMAADSDISRFRPDFGSIARGEQGAALRPVACGDDLSVEGENLPSLPGGAEQTGARKPKSDASRSGSPEAVKTDVAEGAVGDQGRKPADGKTEEANGQDTDGDARRGEIYDGSEVTPQMADNPGKENREAKIPERESFAIVRGCRYVEAFLPGDSGNDDLVPLTPLQLAMPTMLNITLLMEKGVLRAGAFIHAASSEHIAAWERGRETRADIRLCGSFEDEAIKSSLNLAPIIGAVTSGGVSVCRGVSIGRAVCEASAVRHALATSAAYRRALSDLGEEEARSSRDSTSAMRSPFSALVVVRASPGARKGNCFRPAVMVIAE